MANVLAGRVCGTATRLALKRIELRSTEIAAAVRREVAALRAIGCHPNVVRLRSTRGAWKARAGEEKLGQHVWLNLEFCSGGSIESALSLPLSVGRLRCVLAQVADALAAVAAAGFAHCDVKPSNLLLLRERDDDKHGEPDDDDASSSSSPTRSPSSSSDPGESPGSDTGSSSDDGASSPASSSPGAAADTAGASPVVVVPAPHPTSEDNEKERADGPPAAAAPKRGCRCGCGWRVKLADFGFARPLEPYTKRRVEGTVRYVAPEMMVPSRNPAAADSWAFGALAYELATGTYLYDFPGSEDCTLKAFAARIFRDVISDAPVPLPDLRSDAPPAAQAWHKLLQDVLRKDPAQRLTPALIHAHPFFCTLV